MKHALAFIALLLTATFVNAEILPTAEKWTKRSLVDDFKETTETYYVVRGHGQVNYSDDKDWNWLTYWPERKTLSLRTDGFYACGDSMSTPDQQTVQFRINDDSIMSMVLFRYHSSYSWSAYSFNTTQSLKIKKALANGGTLRFRVDTACGSSQHRFDGKIVLEQKFPSNS